jgi:ribose transport system substrate-binding protein
MKNRSLCTIACLITLTPLLSACQKQPEETTGGPPAAPPDTPAASSESRTIAVVPKGVAFDFWLTVKAGAEAAGREENAQILWNGPDKETNVAGQIAILEDFINRKVDAIVMAATDATALVDTIKKASTAGIPVVTIDSGVASDIPVSLIATDNEKGAAMAAEHLAGLIGKKGEVGLVPFIQGAATSDARERGFKQGLTKSPNVKLAATLYSKSQSDEAIRVTEDMLTSHPDLAGIFAANEPGAIGCAQVLEAKGKAGKVKLVAFDAAPTEIQALERGTIQALVVQNPYKMGYEGVKAALRAVRDEPVEKRIDTGVAIVTQENLQTEEIQRLLKPPTSP